MKGQIEIEDALAYNKRQGFTFNEILLIQGVCGADETGEWDTNTVIAIACYQEQEDIEPDGKVWRNDRGNTWPVIKSDSIEASLVPATLKLSLWLDDAPKKIATPEYFDKLLELGVTNVALMINRANTRPELPPWELRWREDKIRRATELAAERSITSVLTIWPQPNKLVIDASMKDIEQLIVLPGVEALEVDTEGNWRQWALDGFPNMKEAGRYLALKMREVCELNGHAHTELTTFPSHTENGPDAVVAKFMDVLLTQCYSTSSRKRNGEDWAVPWSHRYGPGRMQDWGMARAALVPGTRKHLACGLAAWEQEGWPGVQPQAAMAKAMQAAIAGGAAEIRLWSSKFVVGHRHNGYSEQFCRDVHQHILAAA